MDRGGNLKQNQPYKLTLHIHIIYNKKPQLYFISFPFLVIYFYFHSESEHLSYFSATSKLHHFSSPALSSGLFSSFSCEACVGFSMVDWIGEREYEISTGKLI